MDGLGDGGIHAAWCGAFTKDHVPRLMPTTASVATGIARLSRARVAVKRASYLFGASPEQKDEISTIGNGMDIAFKKMMNEAIEKLRKLEGV